MKLRNKKTGEIKECVVIPKDENGYPNEYEVFEKGGSLAELNEEWEDCEEPKYIWYIDWKGNVHPMNINNDWNREKEIGNYFETKEDAKKAVEKLKALKRLRDRGFRFSHYVMYFKNKCGKVNFKWNTDEKPYSEFEKDLLIIFGGEE